VALTTRKHGTATEDPIASVPLLSPPGDVQSFFPTSQSSLSDYFFPLTCLIIPPVQDCLQLSRQSGFSDGWWLSLFLGEEYAQIYLVKNKQAISRLAQNYIHNCPHIFNWIKWYWLKKTAVQGIYNTGLAY